MHRSAIAVGISALLAQPALAQDAAAPTMTATPAPAAAPAKEEKAPPSRWYERLEVHGLVDVYYAYNLNRPGDDDLEENFIPATGTSAKRHNEFDLNAAAIQLYLPADPIGFAVDAVYGTATQVVHFGERGGDADLRKVDSTDLIYRAEVMGKLPIGSETVLVNAGIMPSHIGFEGFYSKDNWHYTRPWVGELSPYYQTGVGAAYTPESGFVAKAYVLNGWQVVRDNNRSKAFGSALGYSKGPVTLLWNTFVGPELADNEHDLRLFSDIVAKMDVTDAVSVAAQVDVGYQEKTGFEDALWHAYAGYVRLALVPEKLFLAARGELFRDPENGISGFRQSLWDATLTLEWRPVDYCAIKLETRYDHSTDEVFAERSTRHDGTREDEQILFLIGVAAWF